MTCVLQFPPRSSKPVQSATYQRPLILHTIFCVLQIPMALCIYSLFKIKIILSQANSVFGMTRKQYLSKWWSTGMLKNMSNDFLDDLSMREKLSVYSRKPGARGVGNFSEAEYRGVFGMNHFQSNSLIHDHIWFLRQQLYSTCQQMCFN